MHIGFKGDLLTPRGDDFEWAYHHHAVEVVPGGVGLFDNGNYRAPAFEEPLPNTFSRAVRFAIDEASMEVSQTWSYWPTTEEGQVYAVAMGDADFQPETNNTLVVSGTLVTADTPSRVWVQLLEVTEDDPLHYRPAADLAEVTEDGTPVFEVDITAQPESSEQNATTFEADRIPDIRFIGAE